MNFPRDQNELKEPVHARSAQNPRWKRALDITLIVVSLPLLLPLMLFIALVIRIVSTGPVLFRQDRVGYSGRQFMCLKFWTMLIGAGTGIHQGHLNHLMNSDLPMVKMDSQGDPRLIPFGLLLRSSGLDELPQVINVLFGEMSLVGPRPCLPYEYENYLPWQKERFTTAPGLTGLWQVSGKNRTSFTRMVQLDIDYARGKNLWLDIKIILKTIPALAVQMQDIRKERKSASRSTRPAAAMSDRVANPLALPPTPLARLSMQGGNALTQKEAQK